MIVLFIVVGLLAVAFGGVLLVGAPYVPTLRPQTTAALELLNLQPGQTLLELGSGDGTVLVAAARKGVRAVGIELNPVLVAVSWARTRKYHGLVRIIWGDFWHVRWPEVDGVFSFQLDKSMAKLDARMQKLHKPLVSFAFKIPDREADAQKDGVFLYRYK